MQILTTNHRLDSFAWAANESTFLTFAPLTLRTLEMRLHRLKNGRKMDLDEGRRNDSVSHFEEDEQREYVLFVCIFSEIIRWICCFYSIFTPEHWVHDNDSLTSAMWYACVNKLLCISSCRLLFPISFRDLHWLRSRKQSTSTCWLFVLRKINESRS